jgi:hypothetical protein
VQGCICCTVRGDLIRILTKLLKRKNRFDHILIETTGLADPAPVAQTFFVDDDLKRSLRLDSILTGAGAGWGGAGWEGEGENLAGLAAWGIGGPKVTQLSCYHPTIHGCAAAAAVVDCKHILLHLDEIKPDGIVNESIQQARGCPPCPALPLPAGLLALPAYGFAAADWVHAFLWQAQLPSANPLRRALSAPTPLPTPEHFLRRRWPLPTRSCSIRSTW